MNYFRIGSNRYFSSALNGGGFISRVRRRVFNYSSSSIYAFTAIIISVLSLCIFTGCARKAQPPVQEKNYKRIVSLAPSITEIIFYLGEQRRLAGVTVQCDFPPEAKKLPKVGGFGEPSVERIVSLKPDIVLTSDYKAHPAYAKMLSLGLNVKDFETSTFGDAIGLVQRIGDVIGVHDKAKVKQDELNRRVEEIRRRHAGEKNRVNVYIEIWHSPIMTTGRGSYVSDMIDALGAKNIFDDIGKQYPQISAEAVLARNPDVIFIGYETGTGKAEDLLKARPGWRDISAVRSGRVYSDVSLDLYMRPGPRLVEGLVEFEKRIYGPPGVK